MHLADLTVNFTLNDLTIWIIAGAVGGLVTGQLMKNKGKLILADLFFGIVGGLIGVFVIGQLMHADQYGLAGKSLLALAGGVLGQVVARLVIELRRRAKAAS
jgi:uncharacterized membrane protein YeaQ/YmgE (transglycosylase-associated protein family)